MALPLAKENAMGALGPRLQTSSGTHGVLVPEPITQTKASEKKSCSHVRIGKRVVIAFSLFCTCSLLAMYINILNSIPEFVDESGNSTIELWVGLESESNSININAAAVALPTSIWHSYELHTAACTLEANSKNMKTSMKLVDVAVNFEHFRVKPNQQANVEVSARVVPSPAWPEEQARYNLNPQMGMVAAVRAAADGAAVSVAAVCHVDASANLFNSIETGVVTIKKTFGRF